MSGKGVEIVSSFGTQIGKLMRMVRLVRLLRLIKALEKKNKADKNENDASHARDLKFNERVNLVKNDVEIFEEQGKLAVLI